MTGITFKQTPYPLTDRQTAAVADLSDTFGVLHGVIAARCPLGREKALAFTNLEQAFMWAVRAVTHTPDPAQSFDAGKPAAGPPG